jgi:thioredoxin-like negative regulator of GroEL
MRKIMHLGAIKNEDLSVVYITSKNCNICKIIYPKLVELVTAFEKCEFKRLETDEFPKLAGEFMIFSVPALIIFSKGRELYRIARFLDLEEIQQVLSNYYSQIFKEGKV